MPIFRLHDRLARHGSGGRPAVVCWALYDWGNSAFATTVMAAFFPVFFKQYWSAGVDPVLSTTRLGLANAAASLAVAALAPLLGAMADCGAARKRLLLAFAAIGAAATAALSAVARGDWPVAIAVFVCACACFSCANVFYDAMLTDVAAPGREDAVSALGYSLGYLGGALLLAVNVWMVARPKLFGLEDSVAAMRWSFVTVAMWWALFCVPLAVHVRERHADTTPPARHMIAEAMARLRATISRIRTNRPVLLFLAGYWCYIDGVDTIVRMSIDYGLSIGLGVQPLVTALLIANVVGFPAALAFGWVGGHFGPRRGIFIALAVYIAVTLWAPFVGSQAGFYALAGAIGLVQGGIQALSRSLFARIIPPNRAAEFFGFYNMLGKWAAVIGPVMIGGTGLLLRLAGLGSQTAARGGIISLVVLFVAGAVLLFRVEIPPAHGRRDSPDARAARPSPH